MKNITYMKDQSKKNMHSEMGSDILTEVFSLKNKWWLVFTLVVITFIAFSPSLKNDFVRWDDHAYITENELIKDISFKDLSKFGENVAGNFHPLTLISYAIDYHFFKLNPFYYHLKNLIYHLLNTILVFFFIMKVSKKNLFVSFFAALLFGIHPMHVESVAWVSERKDVLYSFFFLIGLILYYEYKQRKKRILLILLVISFVFSLLAKSAAVVFPVILLLIDYYENKKITYDDIKEKIPLFIMSLLIGLKAINTQTETGAVEGNNFTLIEKIQYASNAFLTYIAKFFYPHELVCYRPFPSIDNYKNLFAFSVLLIIIIFSSIFLLRRKHSQLFFGILFYFISIALVLQIIQIGGSYTSDRYTYLPYIGIGFIYFYYIEKILKKSNSKKYIFFFIIIIQIGTYSFYTFNQTKVWRNTLTLWTNIIEVENNDMNKSFGYDRRGNHYLFLGDTINALNDFNKSIEVAGNNFKAFTYRGSLFFSLKEYDLAMNDFENALKLKPNWIDALKGKGAVYVQNKDFLKATEIFEGIIKLNNNNYEAWNYLGYIFMQQQTYDKALECLNKAISYKNDFTEAIINRENVLILGGYSLKDSVYEHSISFDSTNYTALTSIGINYYKTKEYDMAIDNLNKALQIKPDLDEALRTRAAIYWEQKQYQKTILDITEYLKLNPTNFDMLNRRALCYMYLNQFDMAVNDFSQLIISNPENGNYFQGRAFAYMKTGNNKSALTDLQKAKALGIEVDDRILSSLQTQ